MASATAPMTVIGMLSPSAIGRQTQGAFGASTNPVRLPALAAKRGGRLTVRASAAAASKEQVVAGLTAAALAAALVIPDIAEAAQPGVSSSLKNFLLSIVSGGVVLGVLVGAVIGVSNFDPVKRT